MTTTIARLRELEQAATPGPWSGDDGNIASVPLREERHRIIMRRLDGESIPHPDPDGAPLGYVCGDMQRQPKCEEDEELICAMRNALPALLAVAEAAEAWIARLESAGGHYRDGIPGELMDALSALDKAAER